MDGTISQISSQGKYYVYTLAYPDGRIFYVGKGKNYGKHERIDEHEIEARGRRHTNNPDKLEIIRSIWASGGEVLKRKVAHFDDEMEAYMYEWALMNMTCYADTLANINRGPGHPTTIRKDKPKPLPATEKYLHRYRKHWGCFCSPQGRIYHEVIDIRAFALCHKIDVVKLIKLSNGEPLSRRGWHSFRWSIPDECKQYQRIQPEW
jgi:hypothetical protein